LQRDLPRATVVSLGMPIAGDGAAIVETRNCR
jgi:hypothetical protein